LEKSASGILGGTHTEGRQRPFFNVWRVGLFALFVASLLLYWPALDGQAIWDDHGLLTGNAIGDGTLKGALTQPFLSYFRPGASLSFLLDRTLYGADIFGYHFTNLLLHAGAAVLVAWLGLLLFQSVTAGLVAGLAFAVQPAQVGGVAWVGGRIDALSCVFIALYLCWLVLYCRTGRQHWIWLSALALVVAAFTKEQNAALALLAPLAVAKLGDSGARPFKSAMPVLAGIALFAVTWIFMNPGLHKAAPVGILGILERVCASATHYALLLLGVTKGPLFTLSLVNYETPLALGIGLILLLGLIGGFVWAWRRSAIGTVLMAALLLAYLPVSNLIPIPSLLVGPYRVAVAGIVVALALGWFASAERYRSVRAVLTAGLLFVNTAVTREGIAGWSTELGFFQEVAQADPYSLVGRTNQLAELMEASRAEDAVRNAEEVLDWIYESPKWRDTDWMVAQSSDLEKVGANEGGDEDPRKAVARILFFRSVALDALARTDEGFASMQAAERLDPLNGDVLAALGDHYLTRDRPLALRYYERSVAADPTDWENLRRLAKQRLVDRSFPEAERLYRQVVAIAPLASIAWYELSVVYEAQGRIGEAIQAMKEAEKGFSFDKEGFRARIKELEAKLASP
jgi:tetratricopeptide (TPR) repeat protein